MEKPGFAKRYAFVAADYGSIDAEFFLNGKKYTTPQGVGRTIWSTRCLTSPRETPCRSSPKRRCEQRLTSYTMTAYYVECTEHLEENFEILLRMVTTGYFTTSVQKERGITRRKSKCTRTAQTPP